MERGLKSCSYNRGDRGERVEIVFSNRRAPHSAAQRVPELNMLSTAPRDQPDPSNRLPRRYAYGMSEDNFRLVPKVRAPARDARIRHGAGR